MDQNPNDNQNAPATPAMGDQPAVDEKCHCGRAVASGSCSGCNAPSASCTCEPAAPASEPSTGGEPPAAPPVV